MRHLGILALAVAAACALPLAGCLDMLFTVWNNTGSDMMIGDTDGYAYVNGRLRDVYMRQSVEAGGETRAYLTFLGTFDDPDFDVNNDLNDIYLNIWMFEEETGNVDFRRLIHSP